MPWVCGVGRIGVSLRSAFLVLTLRALLLRGGCGAAEPARGAQALPAGRGGRPAAPDGGDPRLPRRWAVIDSRPAGTQKKIRGEEGRLYWLLVEIPIKLNKTLLSVG